MQTSSAADDVVDTTIEQATESAVARASEPADQPIERRHQVAPIAVSGVTLGTALLLMFALLGFFVGSQVIADNSFFTHLANGRGVLDGVGIPRVDAYSYTAAGQKVTVQSWLATIVYAALEASVGGWSIRALNGALAALIAAGTWKLTDALEHLFVRIAMVGAMLGVGALTWGSRPTLFGLLGFVALLLAQQGRLSPRWLLPIMWIWVNTHGSFPLGIVAIGAIAVGHVIDHRELPRHELRVLGWAVLGTLSGAIGPLGFEILWFPIHLMARRDALVGVSEWSPPAFDGPLGILLVAFVGLHVVAAARGARWKTLLPGAVFLYASALAVRNMAPGVLVFAACLSPFVASSSSSLSAVSRGVLARGLALVSVLGLALGVVLVAQQPTFDLTSFPVEEVDWLEARDLVANPDIHLIQRDTVGNYLELRYGRDASVFVDDRFDFYPLDVLDDHRSLFFGGDYRAILDRYDADVVLWNNDDSGFVQWLHEADEWTIARSDDEWLIACRVGSAASERCD